MVRPRSEEAHEKVIHAALALFVERGIEATSMDAIAHVSGVSKATIYKHWADKEALLMETMCHVHGLDEEREDVDTGDLERDITAVLSRRPPGELDEARTRMMPAFIAYSAVHPEFGAEWRHRVMDPPRQALRRILQHGIKLGLLKRDLDMEVAAALMLGPLLYWHIFVNGKKARPDDRHIGPDIARAFCRAFLMERATSDKRKSPGVKTKRARR
ncbi:MAG TPA: TetR/AcrR family transcriptional regulator [Terracidiphilus sp.]|nr:TetR/AcrR family transcriptional regulator [Terracidiphilus sp.]